MPLTDLFAAPADEAESSDLTLGPEGTYPTVQAKNVAVVQLTNLHRLLAEGGEGADGYKAAREYDPDGPWVITVPRGLRDALAAADEGHLDGVAARWAETEELRRDGYDAPDLLELLKEYAALARAAQEVGHELFLWVCL